VQVRARMHVMHAYSAFMLPTATAKNNNSASEGV
jgi:hypothetical protein